MLTNLLASWFTLSFLPTLHTHLSSLCPARRGRSVRDFGVGIGRGLRGLGAVLLGIGLTVAEAAAQNTAPVAATGTLSSIAQDVADASNPGTLLSARLRRGDDAYAQVRLGAKADFNGLATLTYWAWDQTSGTVDNVGEGC